MLSAYALVLHNIVSHWIAWHKLLAIDLSSLFFAHYLLIGIGQCPSHRITYTLVRL